MSTTYTPTTSTSDGETFVTDPITTIFTPASWCSTRPYTFVNNGNGEAYYQRDLALSDTSEYGQLGRTTSCYLPNISFHRKASVSGVYYPGVCPLSYTETAGFMTDGTTTKVQCCPSGMTFDTVTVQGLCISQSTVTTPVTVAVGTTTSTTITTNFLAVDWPVMVAWAVDDLDNFTPASAPLLARYTPAPSTSSSSSSSRPASTGSSPKSPAASKTGNDAAGQNSGASFSSGTGAGIGVGVAIAALAFIALIVWLCMRRRRKGKQRLRDIDAPAPANGSGYNPAYEAGSADKYESGYDPVYEAGSADKYELMHNAAVPVEVDGASFPRAEMEGDWRGHELEELSRGKSKPSVYVREE